MAQTQIGEMIVSRYNIARQPVWVIQDSQTGDEIGFVDSFYYNPDAYVLVEAQTGIPIWGY